MSWVSPDETPEGLAAALGTRARLLAALSDGPREKRALRDELGVARSTVYKGLRECAELGLVRETNGKYELTAFGALAGEAHASYRERLDELAAARDVLTAVPADADVPASFAEGARVATADRNAPERPLETFEEFVEGGDCVRSLSPAALPRYMADLHEDVLAGETRELVVERGAARALEVGYEEFDAALDAGLDVYVLDEPLPFGLTLFDDDAAALTTYDSGGVSGILACESAAGCAWAAETYADYRDRAERV